SLSAGAACDATATWTAPTAADNCTLASFTSTHNSGAVFALGTTTVTYTATDAAGNTSTCSFNVTVTDDTDPVISGCPSNITRNAAPCTARATWTAPTVSDNCSGASISRTSGPPSGTFLNIGTHTITYTAIDGSGNTSTCSFTVTIVDVTPPAITCPNDTIIPIDAGLCAATSPELGIYSAATTCSSGLNVANDAVYPMAVGNYTVTWTATDNSGNSSSCAQQVTIIDAEAPVAVCQNLSVNLDNTGNVSITAAQVDGGTTDNCSIASMSVTPNSFTAVGTYTVTLTVTDAAGNTDDCTATVTVTDNNPPVAVCQPVTIYLDAAGNASIVAADIDGGSTDNGAIASLVASQTAFDCSNIGANNVTLTVTDGGGNTNDCVAIVTVMDTITPVVSGCPANISLSAGTACTAVATWTAPTAADNCTVATFASSHNSGDAFPLGTTTVTYSAEDAAGNQSTCSFDVTVTDDTDPVISGCPGNISLSAGAACDAIATWTAPTAADNCTLASFTSTHNSGDAFSIGTTTVTYTATDAAGNQSTCSFDVTVTDDTDPVISGCPGNISLSAGTGCDAVATWTAPTASDNCTLASFTSDHNSGDAFPLGTTTVTYTATDAAGNSSTCVFDVTVTDDTDPVISGCPSNISLSAGAGCDAVATWTTPTVSDNCSGASISGDHSSGDAFPLGTTTVTYTATDAAGNQSTCSFDVTVTDDTDPVISGCPSNISLSAGAGCDAVASWTAPTASDNCTLASFTSDHNSGDAFPLGTTTVTYTATDAEGNQSTCSFDVTVTDDTDPVISGCPSNISLSAGAACDAIATWTAPTAADNCTLASFTSTHNSGDAFPLGTTTVTYTATDAAGNQSTCSFDVTVTDDTDPVISGCPSNISLSAGAGCDAVATWTAPTASDNCTLASFTSDHNSGDAFPIGTTTVTYTATDAAGNTSTCTFMVTVADNTAPLISGCPGNISLSAGAACTAVATWTAPTANDNCTLASFTSDHNSGDAFPIGTTTVTYTATDAAGNSSTCSFSVTVADNTDPVISGCPGNISLSAGAACTAVATWTAPTAADNCSIASFTSDHNSGDAFPLGTTMVTYTATDAAGNQSTCSFTVTVADNTDPVISGCPGNISLSAGAACTAVATWTAPTAADNCTIASFTSDHNSGDAFPIGTTTVTYTATDAAGNQSTCSFTVTVTDDTDPVISACPGNISLSAGAACTAVATWTAPTAADNCTIASFTSDHNSGDAFPIGTTT
ncbi:MAG: HYR domain-containing protein, partial [Proteobacteria bacterium]|nr:HYR domain-containing protein [Pseudomonadota bacterium]